MALKISIHAPPRGATDNKAIWDFTKGISIHAPPRGATRAARTEQPHPLYFNSRPSARGDIPSMNATRRGFLFQFTPLREGRRAKPRRSIGIYFYFNSRPSARGDNNIHRPQGMGQISIHAPPRGATFQHRHPGNPPSHFNSRPSARGDMWGKVYTDTVERFQFTPLREGRRKRWDSNGAGDDFNSRPSARGDRFCETRNEAKRRFQFTPLREGRPDAASGETRRMISIHAPPRGATIVSAFSQSCLSFQFTPLREGRPSNRPSFGCCNEFQFTPLREGRLNSVLVRRTGHHFNSRPSARGDCEHNVKGFSSIQFQFTPLREGRPNFSISFPPLQHFNSRPSARGDAMGDTVLKNLIDISIHAPPRGATRDRL